MSNALSSLRARFGRISIGSKFSIGAILCAVIACAASLTMSVQRAQSELTRIGMEKIDQNMNTLWALSKAEGWPARLDGEQLAFGSHVVNGNFTIVDRLKEIGQGTATIFQRVGDDFVRVSTNVPGPNGGRAIGTKLARNAAYEANVAGHSFRGRVDIMGTQYFTRYDPIKDAQGHVIGILYVGIPEAEFIAGVHQIAVQAGTSAAVILLVAVGLLWLTVRRTVRPLVLMVDAMKRIAGGDTGCQIPGSGRGDEIGLMASALAVFRDKIAENKRNAEEMRKAGEAAEAERVEMRRRLAGDFDAAINKVLGDLVTSSGALDRAAGEMHGLAGSATQESSSIAGAIQQASANVQTVAAATEELSSSIAEISQQVNKSASIASKAVNEAEVTNQQVQALAEAAQKIGDIVKLISDIAGQTNLLALNATIEAARAGEAGKGFAVVATEVKSLASQTAKATEDIAGQVGAIQELTGKAVSAIQTIGTTIGDINQIATGIAAAIEEQGAATQEIARNVQEAANGTRHVTESMEKVAAIVQKSGTSAETVVSAARQTSGGSARLQTEIATFLETVRTA